MAKVVLQLANGRAKPKISPMRGTVSGSPGIIETFYNILIQQIISLRCIVFFFKKLINLYIYIDTYMYI